MDRSLIRQFTMLRVSEPMPQRVLDDVAAEEPLEIRVQYWFKDRQATESFAVTMRTPGHDRELAAGLLLSEGIVKKADDLKELRSLGPEPSHEILVELARNCEYDSLKLSRRGYVNSSCGVCGKRSREAISQEVATIDDELAMYHSAIVKTPDKLRQAQAGFARTGGLHAAALVSSDGDIEAVFEDIGRHNALDKLLGYCLFRDLIPIANRLIFMSSRSSFELVQKALMAGAPMLATVGGPSSLAIELARQYGLTLLGFVRDGHFNIYSGEWRIHSYQDEASVPRK